MGDGEYELEHAEVSKKGRHRKKLLYNSILQLMEFYFSDSNLAKDRFLSQLINDDPFIDLNIFLKFNKIRKLNCTLDDIRKAINKSDLIELSEDKEKLRRKVPIRLNENVDKCTVYVENIKTDANHEWVSHIFSEFGNVVYVSIPKYRHNKTNKGFAFVEFEDEQAAQSALAYFESIGCKMPSETSPENLRSIQTFEEKGNDNVETVEGNIQIEPVESDNILEKTIQEKSENAEDCKPDVEKNTKRKLEDDTEETNKKIKVDPVDSESKKVQNENMETEDTENKKKKKQKKDKKKNIIKELGLQVLSKPEWKKMRNRYLDLQKKKMKEFKQYLNRQKFVQKHYDRFKKSSNENSQNSQENPKEELNTKLEFIPGVIVKVKLPESESMIDAKKIKNGREITVSLKHLAPYGEEKEVPIVTDNDRPQLENQSEADTQNQLETSNRPETTISDIQSPSTLDYPGMQPPPTNFKPTSTEVPLTEVRKSTRERRMPNHLQDYVIHTKGGKM